MYEISEVSWRFNRSVGCCCACDYVLGFESCVVSEFFHTLTMQDFFHAYEIWIMFLLAASHTETLDRTQGKEREAKQESRISKELK